MEALVAVRVRARRGTKERETEDRPFAGVAVLAVVEEGDAVPEFGEVREFVADDFEFRWREESRTSAREEQKKKRTS